MSTTKDTSASGAVKILAIAGSLRRDSFNRQLLHAARAMAPSGLHIHIEEGIGALPLFDEDIEQDMLHDSPVSALRARVDEADALLIATPEYNHSMPGVLKNAIDWLSRGAPDRTVLTNKRIAVIGATAGRWGTRLAQAALRQTLFATDSIVLAAPGLYLGGADAVFDAERNLRDEGVRESLSGIVNFLEENLLAARTPHTSLPSDHKHP